MGVVLVQPDSLWSGIDCFGGTQSIELFANVTLSTMAGEVRYDRLILLMTDEELESFSRDWVSGQTRYVEVRRFAGAGDKGRDVVGFRTGQRHGGPWDNYQCKQYLRGVSLQQGLLAIGKILYWASRDEFTAPEYFYFVAPRGLSRKLQAAIDKPDQLGALLVQQWDAVCARAITKKTTVRVDAALQAVIDRYPFHNVRALSLDDIMGDPAVIPLLVERWGADPGRYPPATIPADVQSTEMRYIQELVGAYGERANRLFPDHNAVFADADLGPDLRRQRERFFEADAFQKFYRDNTSATVITEFRKDILYGVVESWNSTVPDTLARVEAVMARAGIISPAGPLAKYAHVAVKQGVCHHFVQDGEATWKSKV